MATFDASQYMRYSMDFTLAVPSILGVAEYAVYLIQITDDQIGFNDVSTGRVITETRILIADGYRSYAAGDGYLNPMVKQKDGEQLILSGGQLTNNTLMLGPIVYGYTANGFTGGIDSQTFQPQLNGNPNQQVYIQLRGNSLSPKSNYFDIKQIVIEGMSSLSYYLLLTANSSVVF